MTIAAGSISVEDVFREAAMARPRVARFGSPTPIHRVEGPSGAMLLKREDLSAVHSFKWRGAANRIGKLAEQGQTALLVAASAGNHAQGVALSAAEHGMDATIFMPRSTPRIKQQDVRRFGGPRVRIELAGDCYDDAAVEAHRFADETNAEFVHAYDDLHVIAGQATIGDEIVHGVSGERPARVYLPIGGGGLAAGVACLLRAHWGDVELIGVEAEGQASMAGAFEAGHPVDLGRVNPFCDGTAVRQAGRITYPLCVESLDRLITVSHDEVCAAMELMWTTLRAIPEPSGALGVAAIVREGGDSKSPPMTVLTGANVDFMTLPRIAARSHFGQRVRRAYRFTIEERASSLVEVLEHLGDSCNIADFQYGKVDQSIAYPVVAFEGSEEELDGLCTRIGGLGIVAEDVTADRTVEFRAIPVRPSLFRSPEFVTIAFPDRGGALREFLHAVGGVASICYFNFTSSGETRGRALMGFEFESPEHRARFDRLLEGSGLPCERIEGKDWAAPGPAPESHTSFIQREATS